ncbi:MAG: FAD-dependent monooxygenase [Clostridia bacterium]|nr:FAD-dependent monooxygenase [Clostridia bacterium]
MIKCELSVGIGYTDDVIKSALTEIYPLDRCELSDVVILKRELVLKDKSNPYYKLSVGLSLTEEREAGLLKMRKKFSSVPDYTLVAPTVKISTRPVVVGSGPAGLFSALILAEAGARPIVLERGESVLERGKKVERFAALGILDPESNVQFGEGGAGTYSDGKLKVGGMDKYKMKVLSEFVLAGVTEDILYSTTAHLGTDRLSGIVSSIRERIISLGGEFVFSARLDDITVKDGKIKGVSYTKGGEEITLSTDDVILAIGHSARDTLCMLYNKGVNMVARPFGIGARIEHPREYINELVYGKNYDARLESANYHLVTHLKNGRSVYSFCMCPGGTVVPAASEEGGIVTNGMSNFMRNGENSNAAFLVSVTPDDFPSDSPLAGFELQERIEKRAYALTGNTYRAPATRLEDMIKENKPISYGSLSSTYPIGTELHSTREYLPDFVADSLSASIKDFDEWMGGFYYPDALVVGPETRTTSPVRLLRGDDFSAFGIEGLYPAGEGAGYSGGIVSSAVDGIKCALALLQKYE